MHTLYIKYITTFPLFLSLVLYIMVHLYINKKYIIHISLHNINTLQVLRVLSIDIHFSHVFANISNAKSLPFLSLLNNMTRFILALLLHIVVIPPLRHIRWPLSHFDHVLHIGHLFLVGKVGFRSININIKFMYWCYNTPCIFSSWYVSVGFNTLVKS